MTSAALPQEQSVFDQSGKAVFEGKWDPKVLAAFFRAEDLREKRVLDMGANRGGLSLELARLGARVHAAEPALDNSLAREVAKNEGLNVEWSKVALFDSHTLGPFDTIVCFGLIYHFRNPHYVLDYLSSLAAPVLYLSTQSAPGDELKLVNRAKGTLAANFDMERGTRGWEPTHPMLVRMLEASGFEEIESLTDRERERREKPKGATNSAYYRARCTKPVQDVRDLNERFEARWGERR